MKSLKTTITFALLTFLSLTSLTTNAQEKKGRIPFTAEPFYYYNPLTINIGKYKKELLTNDTTQLTNLANRIKADINNTDIESLYFLSIRLYDLGKKDDAFYWFHTAKARARVFMNMLDPEKIGSIGDKTFELKQLFLSINQLVGEYLNGYGYNDIDKGLAVIEKVKSEVKNIKSFKEIYKDAHFLDDTNLEKEKTNKEKDFDKVIQYFTENKEKVKKQRIENGTQNKY